MKQGKTMLMILGLLCVMVNVVNAQEEYKIKLTTPRKVGDEYTVKGSGYNLTIRRITVGGEEKQKDIRKEIVQLTADCKVLEVNDNKLPVKESILITECLSVDKDGKKFELLPKGTKVIAYVENKKEVFEVDGKKLDPGKSKCLGLLISLSRDLPTDNEIFGTDKKQKVSNSWKFNKALLIKGLALMDIKIEDQNLKGIVKLESVEEVSGKKCLKIFYNVDAKGFKIPSMPGLTIKQTSMKIDYTGQYPVDQSSPAIEESGNNEMKMVFEGRKNPDAPLVVIEITGKQKKSAKYTYKK